MATRQEREERATLAQLAEKFGMTLTPAKTRTPAPADAGGDDDDQDEVYILRGRRAQSFVDWITFAGDDDQDDDDQDDDEEEEEEEDAKPRSGSRFFRR